MKEVVMRLAYTNEEKQLAISNAFYNGQIGIVGKSVVGTWTDGERRGFMVALTKLDGRHDGQYIIVTESGQVIEEAV